MSVSDSDDSGSLNSMLHVRASELYPKKVLIETQESASIPSPFAPLSGESIEHISRVTEGVLAVSNYRVYFQRSGKDGKGDFNVPLGLIECVEIKELFHIYFQCKDARTYHCSFPTNDACVDWHRKLQKALTPPKNLDELFAFAYYVWATEEGSEEIIQSLGPNAVSRNYFPSEYSRLGFDDDSAWRVSSINSEFRLCNSYPQKLIVPKDYSDQALEMCAKFRSSKRVPAVVWRHRENGMIIARSSQPEVGWFCWRSPEDEELLRKMSEACFVGRSQAKQKLLVIDARSYTTAVANRARGGGCECPDYYPHMEIKFMNLANIHYIRKSFHSLRQLCASTPEQQTNWHSTLESTKWLPSLSLIIQAATRVVTSIEKDIQPVLVHCSDGWDRTTQIVSLAELLLDPYYRTIEGFQVLCEREWLDFGHKFEDRCGIGEDTSEKCPVFLQWLDCVHNVYLQFPCAFEFSKRYLIKLAEHTYSNLFGTFLCNSNRERQVNGVPSRTFSVWKYLNAPKFRNYLYDSNFDKVIWPSFHVRDLEVWRDLYIDFSFDNQYTADNNALTIENGDHNAQHELEHAQGDLENGALNNLGNKVEPMLLSAMNSYPEMNGESGISNGDVEMESLPAAAALPAAATVDDLLMANNTHADKTEVLMANLGGTVAAAAPASVATVKHDVRVNDTNSNYCHSRSNGTDEHSYFKHDGDDGNDSNIKSNGKKSETNGEDFGDDDDDVVAATVDSLRERVARLAVNGRAEDDATLITIDDNNLVNSTSSCHDEDCDILSNRKTSENSEDCYRIVDEIEMRLNGENSVQSSVETIIDNNFSTSSELSDYKTVNIGPKLCDSEALTNGRQQFTSLLLDPIDGLPLIPDDIQDRMQQISIDHKAKIAQITNELYTTRHALVNKICNQCVHQNAVVNLPEKQVVSDDDKGSVCSTEISWEAVDEKDVGQVLWVPDHAVNFCTKCNSRFWIGRRKHHCRGCGKIFCNDCSQHFMSLPQEQLFDPVRVCEVCYQVKRMSPSSCLQYSNSPKQTTCKQAAAGEETQNSNLILPPAPPI